MKNKLKNTEFKQIKKEFKKLSKVELFEIIYKLQTINLNQKKEIVKLERMLDERGDIILAQEKIIYSHKQYNKVLEVANENKRLLKRISEPQKKLTFIEKLKNRIKGLKWKKI